MKQELQEKGQIAVLHTTVFVEKKNCDVILRQAVLLCNVINTCSPSCSHNPHAVPNHHISQNGVHNHMVQSSYARTKLFQLPFFFVFSASPCTTNIRAEVKRHVLHNRQNVHAAIRSDAYFLKLVSLFHETPRSSGKQQIEWNNEQGQTSCR